MTMKIEDFRPGDIFSLLGDPDSRRFVRLHDKTGYLDILSQEPNAVDTKDFRLWTILNGVECVLLESGERL